MKTCPVCREKITITSKLCSDCKKIKSFVRLRGKDILIKYILNYSSPNRIGAVAKMQRQLYPSAPLYNNQNNNYNA